MSRRLAAITLVAIFLLLLLASAWLNAVGLPDPRGPTTTLPPGSLAVIDGDWRGLPAAYTTPILAQQATLTGDDLGQNQVLGLLVTRDWLMTARADPALKASLLEIIAETRPLIVWGATTRDIHEAFLELPLAFSSSGGQLPVAYAYVIAYQGVTRAGEVVLSTPGSPQPAGHEVDAMLRLIWSERQVLMDRVDHYTPVVWTALPTPQPNGPG